MIENKEEYKKKCKELTDAMSAQFEVVSTVGHLQTLYGMDAKLSDIKKTAEAEAKKAMDKLDAFRKEETDALIAINAKYDTGQILNFIANGYDSIDMVNAYLEGKL
jgi:DNA topoisomerase IA